MIDVFYIGSGNTLPPYDFEVRDKNGAVNLSTVVSATFRMTRLSTASIVVSAVAVLTDTLNGLGQYNWAVGDTAVTGQFSATVEFETSTGGKFTLPRNEVAKVVVETSNLPGGS